MERHHVGKLNTRGDSTGYPPWVHFFLLWKKVLARVGDWSKEQMNKVKQCGEATFMLGAVIMDCRGLVDPQNKPFGNVLPLEMQVKIMFWVHCFYTMDKRKKVVQEFKGLPKCDLTGLSQHLSEDRHWNQVVVRLHVPRRNGCHHCHRLMDHRLSVSEKSVLKEHAIIFNTHLLFFS